MSAAETLAAAQAAGVMLGVDGMDLLIEADYVPPPELLDALRRDKGEILALLRTREIGEETPPAKTGNLPNLPGLTLAELVNEQTKEDAAGGYALTRFNALICCAKSDCLAPFRAVHLHHRLFSGGISMARTKNEVLTIRTTAEVKTLLKLAAERERRSAASMIEVLVLDYAKAHGLHVSSTERAAKQNRIHDE